MEGDILQPLADLQGAPSWGRPLHGEPRINHRPIYKPALIKSDIHILMIHEMMVPLANNAILVILATMYLASVIGKVLCLVFYKMFSHLVFKIACRLI